MVSEGLVALLPMKANSERVKGKNFKDICGKPLFWWILESLLEIEEIEKVVINTDARGLLAENGLVEDARVQVRDRKPKLCGDAVSMNLVLADDVQNVSADRYLMTHTTNPLLSAKTIRRAIGLFEDRQSAGADSLFSVNKFQTRFYREDCSPINHEPTNLIPTQDLEPWFEENSCLYLFTAESFGKTRARIGSQPVMFTTPKLESVDIDEPEDWMLAEALLKARVGAI